MKSRFEILLPGADTRQAGDWCWRDDWNLPGQSAFMLFARFQQLNALSCTALAELFLREPSRWTLKHGIDLRDMRRFDLLQMSDLMCIPLCDVAAAFLPVRDASRGAGPQQLMWCMQCAARGIHLAVFQSDGCKTCPVHGSPLRDRCIQCGEALMTYRLQVCNFRLPLCCPTCGHNWVRSPGEAGDPATRISPAYRSKVAQSLARDWFGRRSSNLRRLLANLGQSDVCEAWLASAPPRVSGADELGGFCARVVQGQTERVSNAVIHPVAFARDSVEKDVDCRRKRVGDLHPSKAIGAPYDLLPEAIACYKAIRRYLIRHVVRGHRRCVYTAGRYLTWRLDACTTTPFCPVAQAVLRWRSKWEGVGVPAHLFVRCEHGLLGVLVWLSLFAPVGLPGWTRSVERWTILRVFALACLDSFSCYLEAARDGSARSGPLWMPFPTVDYPEREWVVLDPEPDRKQYRMVIAPAPPRPLAFLEKLQAGAEHYRHHFANLHKAQAPENWPTSVAKHDALPKIPVRPVSSPLTNHRRDVGLTAMVLAMLTASDGE
ncbi:hypothetical protein [Paraburkholderia hospita]|uniref:hypothetical protein n=1 Tax=Paraburkholderia hospita TaxID=169430 RepID=UPI00030CF145|nr:hypothetical protein [Paraburkholderia hospita]